jgi:hypothetical protein
MPAGLRAGVRHGIVGRRIRRRSSGPGQAQPSRPAWAVGPKRRRRGDHNLAGIDRSGNEDGGSLEWIERRRRPIVGQWLPGRCRRRQAGHVEPERRTNGRRSPQGRPRFGERIAKRPPIELSRGIRQQRIFEFAGHRSHSRGDILAGRNGAAIAPQLAHYRIAGTSRFAPPPPR